MSIMPLSIGHGAQCDGLYRIGQCFMIMVSCHVLRSIVMTSALGLVR
ncbi:unnamed protein product [Mycetohabitans rhizoxinica HKI 454]|uniref:Uncharacterized protein n=1 Tax=Mycetohabitans rhizoxinica (strain DSM 19002 / CIP 109453 / HKI 454) TaxID=882378 RepID=E5AQT7_MYCRK|nr:unnamed protein product [Mycetohabitans rhizoxinica HKI 454]